MYVYNTLKTDHCQTGTCIKGYLQEFVQRPTVFNSVIDYLHHAIYGFVNKDHITVQGVTTPFTIKR